MGSLPLLFQSDVISFRWSRHRQLQETRLNQITPWHIRLVYGVCSFWRGGPSCFNDLNRISMNSSVSMWIWGCINGHHSWMSRCLWNILYPALLFELCSTVHTNTKSTNMAWKRGRSTKMRGQTAVKEEFNPSPLSTTASGSVSVLLSVSNPVAAAVLI